MISNPRNLRFRDKHNLPNEQCIEQFISDVGESLLVDLIAEIENAMKETTPVLSGFDLFYPECLEKSEQNRKELSQILINHYGYVKKDSFEG